jgi:hypothetical protein
MKNKKPKKPKKPIYRTIELRDDGLVLLSRPLVSNSDTDFVEWREIDSPLKLAALLASLTRSRWISTWTVHEILLAAFRHFEWEWTPR